MAVVRPSRSVLANPSLPRPHVRSRRGRLRDGGPDLLATGPGLEPAPVAVRRDARGARRSRAGPRVLDRLRTDIRVRRALARRVPADRLPGRVLPRTVSATEQGAAARPSRRALLGQLHDADARLDRAAAAGRARQPGSHGRGDPLETLRLARRPGVVGRVRPHLRLCPLSDPSALRGARPDRPERARGGPRSRRQPDLDLPPRDAAPKQERDPRRERADSAADVRRLLHERPDLELAEDLDDRQPDQPLRPGRHAADRRCVARHRALAAARRAHVLLPVGHGARLGGNEGVAVVRRVRDWFANPWGQPRLLAAVTWLYMVWAIVPVAIAILFSFNNGRSRSVWQGFSTRWWWGDPDQSVLHDPALRGALEQSLRLAALDMLIAVPLGVGLAIGLTRWRGFGARPVNFLMLFPLVTPEIVMAVSLLLVFVSLYRIQLGTTAQALGQVTFSISYVVLVVRGRLLSVGRQYEEAARDLGASTLGALRLVLMPLLAPAILASLMVVFALSIDDFVVTDYLSSTQSTQTVPIKIYSGVRGTTTPALNALATVMVVATLLAVALAFLVYRRVNARQQVPGG